VCGILWELVANDSRRHLENVAATAERHQQAAVGIASSILYTIFPLVELICFHRTVCLKRDAKKIIMQFFPLLFIVLLLIPGMAGYQTSRAHAER
jgi:hypothetical protein